jgi:uncharacterized protein YbjT (DUF2867 family)
MLRELAQKRILLTGASGFVGRHRFHTLQAAGCEVRCASRNPERARRHYPNRDWVRLDLEDPATVQPALEGCYGAYYLIHGMSDGDDYEEREARSAEIFVTTAQQAGLQRIVYLGGVQPTGSHSRHLRSRLRTGEILRQGSVSTVELRAAMVIGSGGSSWEMVRDLSVRLPMMVLPKWLQNRSQPIAVADVVFALLAALVLPDAMAGTYDLPGPESISHRALLQLVAAIYGRIRPLMIDVPVLTPTLSSYWITLVTRANGKLARELVQGLTSDLLAADAGIWQLFPQYQRTPLDQAIRHAFEDENASENPSPRAQHELTNLVKDLDACMPR